MQSLSKDRDGYHSFRPPSPGSPWRRSRPSSVAVVHIPVANACASARSPAAIGPPPLAVTQLSQHPPPRASAHCPAVRHSAASASTAVSIASSRQPASALTHDSVATGDQVQMSLKGLSGESEVSRPEPPSGQRPPAVVENSCAAKTTQVAQDAAIRIAVETGCTQGRGRCGKARQAQSQGRRRKGYAEGQMEAGRAHLRQPGCAEPRRPACCHRP